MIRRILTTLRDAWTLIWADPSLTDWDGGPTW